MRKRLAFLALALLVLPRELMAAPPEPNDPFNAAQINTPPSASKLRLIREFLKLTGIQEKIDKGSFLEMYALPGQPLFTDAAERGANFKESYERAFDALRRAYEPRRHVWQELYESHLNWEFTQDELSQIVAFLRTHAGQHYLAGRWRLEAYNETNTEDLIREIVGEAETALKKRP